MEHEQRGFLPFCRAVVVTDLLLVLLAVEHVVRRALERAPAEVSARGATHAGEVPRHHVARADQPIKIKREYEPPLRQFVGEVGAAAQTAMTTMV